MPALQPWCVLPPSTQMMRELEKHASPAGGCQLTDLHIKNVAHLAPKMGVSRCDVGLGGADCHRHLSMAVVGAWLAG